MAPEAHRLRSFDTVTLGRLVLARSGLLRWWRGRAPHAEGGPWREELHGEEGVLEAIRRLEAVQLDPVAVVERNHHLVLLNRVGGYRPEQLEALYHHKLVFEYWAGARCVMPVEDYHVFEPVRARFRAGLPALAPAVQRAMAFVREHLAADGPLPARRLEAGERVQGYWDLGARGTKATSQALEHLWEAGEVVIAFRRADERHFALATEWFGVTGGPPEPAARSSAARGAAPGLTAQEAARRAAAGRGPGFDDVAGGAAWTPLLHKYLRACGVVDEADPRFGWRRMSGAERRAAVGRLVAAGVLAPVEVKGVRRRYYVLAELIPLLESMERATVAPDVYVLPPLDNVLWRRERVADLFGFAYTWEIYLKPARRRFGPYTMPVLEGDRFVGRLDARLDRERGVLVVERLWFEAGVEPSGQRLERLRMAIEALAQSVGASRVWAAAGVLPGASPPPASGTPTSPPSTTARPTG